MLSRVFAFSKNRAATYGATPSGLFPRQTELKSQAINKAGQVKEIRALERKTGDAAWLNLTGDSAG